MAAHRIVARLGGVHDDDIPGSGDNMPGFGKASLITTTDSPSPLTIDWASLGQSEFDLPGTSVSASRSRPDTQLVINLETLGRSELTMPGDDAGMEMAAMTESAPERDTRCQVRPQIAPAGRVHVHLPTGVVLHTGGQTLRMTP